jgi:DNA topoisomerase-2
MSKTNKKTIVKPVEIEDIYKKKSLHQHILDLPDTYIGPTHLDKINLYVYDNDENRIIRKDRDIVLGLYKIFDEILVNAADQTVRDKKCNTIKVAIDMKTGIIEVYNNGSSIPIEKHKVENMYVPEMIFGNLLTSGNYDTKGKTVGGKNGLGSKLTNVYSTFFDVEILDLERKKKYYQRFKNNMFEKDEAVVTDIGKNVTESYTKITFLPDYKRFGLKNLTDDMESILKRRVYDIAGTTNSLVKVFYNDVHIDVKTFEDYIKLYYAEEVDVIYADINERWSVGVVYDSNASFQHMSFVNKISTFQGGTHLNYVVNQIVDKVTANIQDKHKNLKIKPSQIKDNITVFINSTIEDPGFSSQSKESLTTKASEFNVKCELDDKFITKLCKTGLVDEIVQLAQVKQLAELNKSDGKKVTSLRKLVKLDDARLAGTKRSSECRLILTEGDSAKSFAISGLEVIGRDKYGVFPLKGKLLNVRDASPKQLLGNEEIKNLKQILGLKQNTNYTDTKKLRYGGIIILTDQDVDGSHIKGLLMNFFHFFWPSLMKLNGFIQSIATPIIKVFKKSDNKKTSPEIFYTLTDYKKWCEKMGDSIKSYDIKYYKGLGTSTEKEAKESFTDFEKRIVTYIWNESDMQNKLINADNYDLEDDVDADDEKEADLDAEEVEEDEDSNQSEKSEKSDLVSKKEKSYQSITLAFAKQRANDRKEWLRKYDPDLIIENANKNISYDEFVNKDLIHFSNSDNIRSIPDISDGLKPSQRKILFGALKRKLDKDEIKVAQLAAYISEHTGYHHGEASLQGAIINMAQDYCGSNNINLLRPNGNFGSRRMGGKDAASSRYIFTQLSELTRQLFITKDEPILEYNVEEGDVVEPKIYYPIIPTILVNGSEGIGTGFSTNIPPYNPLDIIANIRNYLENKNLELLSELTPWFKGFEGRIEKINDCTYNTFGISTTINENTVKITELPIGTWTENYLEFLECQVEDGTFITDYKNNSGNYKIDIEINFANGKLQGLIKTDTLNKRLKLVTSVKTSNMHLYKDSIITKYKTANHILEDYIKIRLNAYKTRKEYVIRILTNDMLVLKYRKKFIENILDKKIIIERKKKSEIVDKLIELKYPELAININGNTSYDYLTNLPLFSLTAEKIDDINKEFDEKKLELDVYTNTSVDKLWLTELDDFEKSYRKWITLFEDSINENKPKKGAKTVKGKVTKTINTGGKDEVKEVVKEVKKAKQAELVVEDLEVIEEKPTVKKGKNIKIIDTPEQEIKPKSKAKK